MSYAFPTFLAQVQTPAATPTEATKAGSAGVAGQQAAASPRSDGDPGSFNLSISVDIWHIVLAMLLIGTIIYASALRRRWKLASSTRSESESFFRNQIAAYLLSSSIWGLIAIASLIILAAIGGLRDTALDKPMQVFNLLLPVVGTWVGTLLAFYFSRENFESASKSVQAMATVASGAERLKSTSIDQVMLGGANSPILTLPNEDLNKSDDAILLKSITTLLDAKKADRLPLFAGNAERGVARGVIHLSTIEKFVRRKAQENPPVLFDTLHLSDLLKDPVAEKLFGKSFAVVPAGSTLADAKAAMDRHSASLGDIGNCYDVFVTADGKAESPVLGWITNDIINQHAKV